MRLSLLDGDDTSESFKSGNSDNWITFFAFKVDFRFVGWRNILVIHGYNKNITTRYLMLYEIVILFCKRKLLKRKKCQRVQNHFRRNKRIHLWQLRFAKIDVQKSPGVNLNLIYYRDIMKKCNFVLFIF